MALTTNIPRPVRQSTSYMKNGMSYDLNGKGGVPFTLQSGVPLQNLYMFRVIPASLSSVCISNLNTWQVTGQPLNQVNTGSGNNIISKAINLKNLTGFGIANRDVSAILLDCERCISLNFPTVTTSDTEVTATGYDFLGNRIIVTADVPSGTTRQVLSNPMSIVESVVFSENPGVSIQVGNSNNIGLPYYLTNKSYIISCTWNGSAINPQTSQVQAAHNWRVSTTTSTSGATRGYITTSSNTDGTALLTCCYYVMGSDSEVEAELNNAIQSTLKIASIQISTGSNPQNVIPQLTQYDLTGVVYPNDNDFIYAYSQAKLS